MVMHELEGLNFSRTGQAPELRLGHGRKPHLQGEGSFGEESRVAGQGIG